MGEKKKRKGSGSALSARTLPTCYFLATLDSPLPYRLKYFISSLIVFLQFYLQYPTSEISLFLKLFLHLSNEDVAEIQKVCSDNISRQILFGAKLDMFLLHAGHEATDYLLRKLTGILRGGGGGELRNSKNN